MRQFLSQVSQPIRWTLVSLLVLLTGFSTIVLHRRGQIPVVFDSAAQAPPPSPPQGETRASRFGPSYESAIFAMEGEVFRLERRKFSIEPESFLVNARRFVDIPASLGGSQTNGSGKISSERLAGESITGLRGYRAGVIELNETKEFSNKITLGTIDWQIPSRSDASGKLSASGTTSIGPLSPLSITLVVQTRGGGFLREIAVAQHDDSTAPRLKGALFVALELRSTDQKRGAPITKGMVADQASVIGYQADRIDEQSAADVAVLFRNSQWLDIPMRKGQQKYLVSIELPDFSAIAAP